jgi:Xaa-Pro aminopeptidase
VKDHGSYLSSAERERRYAGLRQIMADAGCVAAIVVGPAQIGGKRYFRYFTDWNLQSFGGYLLVRASASPVAIFRAWSQAYWSGRVEWIQDIVAERDPLGGVFARLAEGAASGRIGIIGTEYLSVTDHGRLEQTLGPRLVDLTPQVDELTAVKSAEEQALLRDAGAIFDGAWSAVLSAASPGLHEWELASVAGRELLAHGVSHSIILIGASSPGAPAACVGWPRDRALTAADRVQMSIEGPAPNGYCVEIGGTFTFGQPPADLVTQFEVQAAGMQAGVDLLRDGCTSAEVATAVDEVFRRGGYQTGYPGMHGIGYGIPEPPAIDRDSHRRLVAGNVVAMHPNAVSDAGIGTLTSRTYIVGPRAAESLSQLPMSLARL